MNKTLVFIVEGDSEVSFINKKIIPYIYSFSLSTGWLLYPHKVTTNRKLNIKGGIPGYQYLKNEIDRLKAQNEPLITTFFDFFRIPTDFPGYSIENKSVESIESAIKEEVNYEGLIPYIQKYEFETILFSNPEAFDIVLDNESQMNQIKDIADKYPDIETINGGPETAPSKRLAHIFDYDKVTDSELILENISIEQIQAKCARFSCWLEYLFQAIEHRNKINRS